MAADMSGTHSHGFTIIETLLFFAISGGLVIGVIGAAGYGINLQRYRDATTSLVSYVQGQYDQTINVQNDRSNTLDCDISTGVRNAGAGGTPVGMTECAVVGRFVQSTDGATFTSTPVFGDARRSTATNDLDSLIAARLFTNQTLAGVSSYQLPWDTRIVQPASDTVMTPINMLIVRAPASGAVMTFVGASTGDTPDSLVKTAATTQREVVMCLDAQGLFTGQRSGATIARGSANSSGVKPITGDIC